MNISLPLGPEAVREILPHRDPMLFVDRVTALTDSSITIEADIHADAPFFKGHFPDLPIMPGVLIIETVAQAGVLLIALTKGLDKDKFIAFSGVESAKFKSPVYPNETLIVDVEFVKVRPPFYKFSGTAHVNGKLVTKLQFTATQMAFDQGKQ